ncbi:hypothetical protein [Haemophilus paracuniculus]|nr:hypothetical protein [Haemophilus paracuniculus]
MPVLFDYSACLQHFSAVQRQFSQQGVSLQKHCSGVQRQFSQQGVQVH